MRPLSLFTAKKCNIKLTRLVLYFTEHGLNKACLLLCAVVRFTVALESHVGIHKLISLSTALLPPTISGPEVINATIGTSLQTNISARSHNGKSLTFYADGLPPDVTLVNTSKWLYMKWAPSSIVRVSCFPNLLVPMS